jgi:enamine deaminase RidA (YjgF/YER057c/UK114 family)
MSLKFINPEQLGQPKGYANGALVTGGKLLFIAGQVAWNEKQEIVSNDFVDQFDQALSNVIAVVAEAGGAPEDIARLVVYVTDKQEYKARAKEVGKRWRALMGKHFPAMALVEVKGLLEDNAKIEIEGIAVINE